MFLLTLQTKCGNSTFNTVLALESAQMGTLNQLANSRPLGYLIPSDIATSYTSSDGHNQSIDLL